MRFQESFWRQYEEGLLSATGLKELDSATEQAEDAKDVDTLLDPQIALSHLESERWELMKNILKV